MLTTSKVIEQYPDFSADRLVLRLQSTRMDSEDSSGYSSIGSCTAEEGMVRFEDGTSGHCSRSGIQFQHADHLHYGSFSDLVTRAVYNKHREVVVKIVRILDRRSGRNEGRSITDILRKMEIANRMSDEHIARMHGFFIEASEMTCYMLMEPMFASLAEIITIVHCESKAQCERSAVEKFLGCATVDIVKALEFLADQQINAVVTPKRILIREDGQVKICVSSAFSPADATPVRYSAPELIKAAGDYRKTGVWSLGITLMQAATGQHPISGNIDFVIADRILEGDMTRLGSEFSPLMRSFVDECVTRSVYKRASAKQLKSLEFYQHHAQLEKRQEIVMSMLECVCSHLEELRREK